jgi:hypothetical protein
VKIAVGYALEWYDVAVKTSGGRNVWEPVRTLKMAACCPPGITSTGLPRHIDLIIYMFYCHSLLSSCESSSIVHEVLILAVRKPFVVIREHESMVGSSKIVEYLTIVASTLGS